MMTREHIDLLATCANPVCLILLLVAAWAKLRDAREIFRFICRSSIGLIVAVTLAHINRTFYLWPRYLLFPSGHMSFFASVATSFILLDRRWALLTVPLSAAYGFLIISLRCHTWADIIGGMIIAPFVTWICHRILFR